MVNVAFLAALLSAVPALALSPRDVVGRAASRKDELEYYAGSISIYNNCTHNIFLTEKGSKRKPTILVPEGNMVTRLQRTKASNSFTYQLSKKLLDDKNPPQEWWELIYRFNLQPALSEGAIQVYSIFGKPEGKVSVSLSGAATAPGSAAAAAAAGGNLASVAAAAGKDVGSSALSVQATFCALNGIEVEPLGPAALRASGETVDGFKLELGKTYSDLNITHTWIEKLDGNKGNNTKLY